MAEKKAKTEPKITPPTVEAISLEPGEFYAIYTLLAEAAEYRLACHTKIMEAAEQGKGALFQTLEAIYAEVQKERAIKRAEENRKRKAVAMYRKAGE